MATVTRGYNFSTTETVTAAKLHSLVDNATVSGVVNADVAGGAAIASTKIDQDLSGYATIDTTQTITGNKSFTGTNTFNPGITEASILLADNTTNNASTSAHGFLKKLSNVATEFMNGVGNWVSVTIDGLLPTQTGNSGKFLTTNGSASSWEALTIPTQYLKLVSTTTVSGNISSGNITIDSDKNYLIILNTYSDLSRMSFNMGGSILLNATASYINAGKIYIYKKMYFQWDQLYYQLAEGGVVQSGTSGTSTVSSGACRGTAGGNSYFTITADTNHVFSGTIKLYEIVQ